MPRKRRQYGDYYYDDDEIDDIYDAPNVGDYEDYEEEDEDDDDDDLLNDGFYYENGEYEKNLQDEDDY